MSQVRDLLSKNPKNKLDLKEHSESGVYVKELNSFVVKSVQEITSVLEVGLSPCAALYTLPACVNAAAVINSATSQQGRLRPMLCRCANAMLVF